MDEKTIIELVGACFAGVAASYLWIASQVKKGQTPLEKRIEHLENRVKHLESAQTEVMRHVIEITKVAAVIGNQTILDHCDIIATHLA